MIVTSGYSVMLVADRMVYHVSWQCMSWTDKLNKGGHLIESPAQQLIDLIYLESRPTICNAFENYCARDELRWLTCFNYISGGVSRL